jgi:hypothetical protein
MWHGNGKIYSYQTVIGQRVDMDDRTLFLLNEAHYSVSTTKHQRIIGSAIPRDATVFRFNASDYSPKGAWGFKGWWSFDAKEQVKFAVHYLVRQFNAIKEFTWSKSMKTEQEVSTKWFREALRFMELTGACTMPKVLRLKDLELRTHHNISEPTSFRKMIKALMEDTPMPEIVDMVCGKEAYGKYRERTSAARNAAYMRKLNYKLGFASKTYLGHYYDPYPYKKEKPKQLGYTQSVARGIPEGGLRKKDVDKAKKNGTYIQHLLKSKRENLAVNLHAAWKGQRWFRVQRAKERLEKHLGMSWERVMQSYDYNGTTVTFGFCHRRRELHIDEYLRYAKLSQKEQKEWVIEKRSWMLAQLRQDEEHERAMVANREAQKLEAARYRRLLEEKKEYIASMKQRGDEGVRTLWRESLISNGGFYNKDASFFFGGNVLLRVTKDIVETSKGVKIDIAECERLWNFVSRWHTQQMEVEPRTGIVYAIGNNWAINGYRNDIMVAGCHEIAYCEMERIAKRLGFQVRNGQERERHAV